MEAVRPAGEDDIARLVELGGQLREELAQYRGGALWARSKQPSEWDPAAVRAALAAPDTVVFAGTFADAVVGYAVARVVPLHDGARLGVVDEILVEPGAREVGVGEALVDAVLAWCRQRGCEGVDATALPGHRAAKNFFEEQGFVARSLTMYHELSDSEDGAE